MPDLGALFDPKGIIITGVSNHPGKFGFVTLHNLLASGYEGAVYPVSREPGEVLGRLVHQGNGGTASAKSQASKSSSSSRPATSSATAMKSSVAALP